MISVTVTHEDGTSTFYDVPTTDSAKVYRQLARLMDDLGVMGKGVTR